MINELKDRIWEMSDPEELNKDAEARHCIFALKNLHSTLQVEKKSKV